VYLLGDPWVRIAEGPIPSFTLTPASGISRFGVADLLPDGSRVYQRAFGVWTDAPER
jgi:hypothetical protein